MGWKECVPCGEVVRDFSSGGSLEKETFGKQSSILSEQVSPRSNGSKLSGAAVTQSDIGNPGEESVKRRRMSSTKQEFESSTSADETLSAPPCLVGLDGSWSEDYICCCWWASHFSTLRCGVGAMEAKSS